MQQQVTEGCCHWLDGTLSVHDIAIYIANLFTKQLEKSNSSPVYSY